MTEQLDPYVVRAMSGDDPLHLNSTVHQGLRTLRQPGSLKAWLLGLASNLQQTRTGICIDCAAASVEGDYASSLSSSRIQVSGVRRSVEQSTI
jgi:hypothetical protein